MLRIGDVILMNQFGVTGTSLRESRVIYWHYFEP